MKDQHRIDELRKRLYARNSSEFRAERHDLKPEDHEPVSAEWKDKPKPKPAPPQRDTRSDVYVSDVTASDSPVLTDLRATQTDKPKRRRSYRTVIMALSILILVLGLGVSSVYLFLGVNEISGRNIDIAVSGPFSIGAGEVMTLDFTINNANPAPIESVTLVMQYPPGTRSAEDPARSLPIDRIAIDRIGPGESAEVPVQAIFFGEIDEEKEIQARLEYRVAGTNSILDRTIEPYAFRITSAPLAIRVESVERVAAGQEVDVILNVVSNAPTTQNNVLVSAQYPSGFDYTSSSPSPEFSNNVWRIDRLEPEATHQIRIRGVFMGGQDDEFSMRFQAGLARSDNPFVLGTVFTSVRSDFIIEQPFIDVQVAVNGETGRTVPVEFRRAEIQITVRNTLPNPIYDMRVDAKLSGSALDSSSVRTPNGFYSSTERVARFNVSTNSGLTEIPAGSSRTFTIEVVPADVETGTIEIDVDVFGRRVVEERVTETLVGSRLVTAQFTSQVGLVGEVAPVSGPIPPVAETRSVYRFSLVAQAGNNDIVDTIVTTSLPTYVEWLDQYTGTGDLVFNPVAQEITWSPGSISANQSRELVFEVAIEPSLSQVNMTPALVNVSHIRARDLFTGTIVRNSESAFSTELALSLGYERNNGRVVAPMPRAPEEDD